jgi:hypothetical protein
MAESNAKPLHTTFDWRIYADGTCAGLTALLPIPFVDLAFERYFRRRMPETIAKVRRMELAVGARRRFGRGSGRFLSLEGCFAIPVSFVLYIIKKVWRKLVYVLAIADATSLVSAYWQRAYLLDHLISAGHAGPDVDWHRSAAVFEKVLGETDASPLTGLARQTVSSVHRVFRLLILSRRHGAAVETESLSGILRSHWEAAEGTLRQVAFDYNEEYARSLELDPPDPPDAAGTRQQRGDGG